MKQYQNNFQGIGDRGDILRRDCDPFLFHAQSLVVCLLRDSPHCFVPHLVFINLPSFLLLLLDLEQFEEELRLTHRT